MSYQLKAAFRDSVINNNLEMLNKLKLQYNFDLYTPIDLNGLSLLHFAVQNGKDIIVESLCTQMNDINLTDNLGRTPLHYAAAKSDTGILKILLASGANVNCQTIGGETPLMKAIIFSKVQAVRLLLRFGSDVSIPNQAGISSKDLAINNKNEEIINLVYCYEEIFYKLCLIIYTYIKDGKRKSPLNKLTPDMVKKLTRFIIP